VCIKIRRPFSFSVRLFRFVSFAFILFCFFIITYSCYFYFCVTRFICVAFSVACQPAFCFIYFDLADAFIRMGLSPSLFPLPHSNNTITFLHTLSPFTLIIVIHLAHTLVCSLFLWHASKLRRTHQSVGLSGRLSVCRFVCLSVSFACECLSVCSV